MSVKRMRHRVPVKLLPLKPKSAVLALVTCVIMHPFRTKPRKAAGTTYWKIFFLVVGFLDTWPSTSFYKKPNPTVTGQMKHTLHLLNLKCLRFMPQDVIWRSVGYNGNQRRQIAYEIRGTQIGAKRQTAINYV
ncbi:hypothetical protein ROHU_022471 [Labeo rohita]|uniref:Uncharacterized protein n=1 Tax=Labeo rohita TaxID=84645 RepID=A0A498N0I4_LABRO|nr:hypothetical protein ROHU_022471 [Labeo rohita]